MKRPTLSEHTKYRILARQKFQCAGVVDYTCPLKGEVFDAAGYDIDHILPLSQGGAHSPDNLQALCPSCHRVKTFNESLPSQKFQQYLLQFLKQKNWTICAGTQMPFELFWYALYTQFEASKYFVKKTRVRKVLAELCKVPYDSLHFPICSSIYV